MPAALRQLPVLAAAVVLLGVGYALLPDNGDPVEVPATLLWDFRSRSLGLQALLYGLLGWLFGLLTLRTQARVRDDASPRETAPA